VAAEALREFPVQVEIPVAWGDMDAFGHVNNVVYFRYFESARIACFEAVDYMASAAHSGLGPILAATEGSGRIVSYDYRNKCKAPLPEQLAARLAALGKSG
jgi:acyl-CoA thioester hydrolase